jgi:hypothetical protein
MPATTEDPAIPGTDGPTGLPLGQRDSGAPPAPRSGDEVIAAAARGDSLSAGEHHDLLAYYLANGELPNADEAVPVEFTVGRGDKARKDVWHIKKIRWEDWQDARERATNKKSGVFDPFVAASWNVARALVEPKLGPSLVELQQADPDNAPSDAAALLRRMFSTESGVLLELSGEVLRLSKLQDDNESVRVLDEEVDAGKA